MMSDKTRDKYIQRLTFEGFDEPAVRVALEEVERLKTPPSQPMSYLRKILSSSKPSDGSSRSYRVVIEDTAAWSEEKKAAHRCPWCFFIGPHGRDCRYADDDMAATQRRIAAGGFGFYD